MVAANMRMAKRQTWRGKAFVLDSFMTVSIRWHDGAPLFGSRAGKYQKTRRGTNVPPQNNGLQPGMAMQLLGFVC